MIRGYISLQVRLSATHESRFSFLFEDVSKIENLKFENNKVRFTYEGKEQFITVYHTQEVFLSLCVNSDFNFRIPFANNHEALFVPHSPKSEEDYQVFTLIINKNSD